MKAILRFQLPATLGSDLAGVVLEVGHHVTRFKPGDVWTGRVIRLRATPARQVRRGCYVGWAFSLVDVFLDN